MLQATFLSDIPTSAFYYHEATNFYQSLKEIPNTTISLQYDPNTFLSFKVYDASQGAIVLTTLKEIALQCQIRGTTYLLTRVHMDQMSNRERNELFNYLGVETSEFLAN